MNTMASGIRFLLSLWILGSVRGQLNNQEYVCGLKSESYETIDAWSANDLLYLKVSINNATDIFLIQAQRVIHIYQLPMMVFLDELASMQDGIAATILNSKFASQHKSPSVIYFEARTALRNNCQKEWFYEPANSQFCRRHPVIQILHRLLALVDPIPIDETSDRLQMKFFRWIRVQNRRSAQIIGLHRIMTRAAVNQAKDTLSHYITASLMRLKIAHQRKQTRYIRNVRMIFLNRVGMFVSWYVYDVAKWNQLLATNATEESKHCAVMFSVKMQPFISICTETQKPIISIFESDYGIGIILRHNRLISLSNNYLERQFRIENNRNIDLDQLQTVDLHSVIFNCTNNRNLLTIGNVTVSEYHSAEMEEKEEEEEEIGGNETIGKVNGHHRQKRSTGSPPARSSHLGYIALLLGYVGICCAVLAFLYFMRHK